MKINGIGSITELLKTYSSQKKATITSGKETQLKDREDMLDLSAEARSIKDIYESLKSLKDVREEKVAQLKKEIEDGTFRADIGKIAEGIINERLLDKQV